MKPQDRYIARQQPASIRIARAPIVPSALEAATSSKAFDKVRETIQACEGQNDGSFSFGDASGAFSFGNGNRTFSYGGTGRVFAFGGSNRVFSFGNAATGFSD